MTAPDAIAAAERAWDTYVREARRRARMETAVDPSYTPQEKVAQQRRADAAFAVFRDAFSRLDPPQPAQISPAAALAGVGRCLGRMGLEKQTVAPPRRRRWPMVAILALIVALLLVAGLTHPPRIWPSRWEGRP